MSALETSIAYVNSRIHDMYEEDSLHQYEYRLHAVMVHEGGVDSGHYWAYVQDHRDESLIGISSEKSSCVLYREFIHVKSKLQNQALTEIQSPITNEVLRAVLLFTLTTHCVFAILIITSTFSLAFDRTDPHATVCHRRKVWLKCNDNTVVEATLEELQRESVGGYCNTSAYSLMYIAAAKVPMLMDSEEEPDQSSGHGNVKGSPGGPVDDRMDQETAAAVPATCDLESAYRSLPNDLAEFVREDNIEFVVEKRRWDEEQEARAKKQRAAEEQEMQMVGKDPGAEVSGTSTTPISDGNGDVMVVQEKLTYVHTHAKLSLDVTLGHIGKVDVTKGVHPALKRLIVMTREYYMDRVSAGIAEDESEPMLESMVAYLLKNRVPEGIVEMALYEQFSLPGLDNASQSASVVRNYAVKFLEEMRSKRIVEDASLKEWHQVSHIHKM